MIIKLLNYRFLALDQTYECTMRQLFININGNIDNYPFKKSNILIISNEKELKINYDHTLLQTDFKSVDELIKAIEYIKIHFNPIDEIIISNKDIDLNMISYQHDYNFIKDSYLTLTNLIFFLNLLIKCFNKNIDFILLFEKESHFKIHTNNLNRSVISYLRSLKKDLININSINIKK